MSENQHLKAFQIIMEKGLPEPGVFLREIAVGFRRLGMDPEACRPDCRSSAVRSLLSPEKDPRVRESVKLMCKHGFVDKDYYRKVCQEDFAERYGFGRANSIRFIDVLLKAKSGIWWIVEITSELNFRVLGQVLVYKASI